MSRMLKIVLSAVLGIGLVLTVALWWVYWRSINAGPTTAFTLAVPMRPATAAAWIAKEAGLFTRERLAVQLQPEPTGKAALERLLAGAAEVALTAETPLVFAALNGKSVVVLASIFQSTDNNWIIARKDRGILVPGDLSGKRLGYQPGTSTAYFAHAYLLARGVVDAVMMELPYGPERMAQALMDGDEVDAVVMVPPFSSQAESWLGANAIAMHDPTVYQVNFVLVSTRAWAESNPQAVHGLLRALIAATGKIRQQPDAAFAEVAALLELSPAQLKPLWEPHGYSVRLHPELLATLENQKQWALRKNLVAGDVAVKMHDLMWFPGLGVVEKGSVTIRH